MPKIEIPENLKGYYLAFVLSEKSRVELLKYVSAKYSRVLCHHVTVEFNPTLEIIKRVEKEFSGNINVYGGANLEGVQCVGVSVGQEKIRPDGKLYHCTISVEPPHKPVESNKAMEKGVGLFRGIFYLEGELKLIKK